MARCKACGSELVKKKTKTGEVILYCESCKKGYRMPVAKPVVEEEEEEVVAPKVAPKAAPIVKVEEAPKCKICGTELVERKAKSGEMVLFCSTCKKAFRKPAPDPVVPEPEEEDEEEEEEEKEVVKLDETPKCKICGSELVERKTKSGEEVLYCKNCKKGFKKPAPVIPEPPVEEEEEEEEEEVVAPIPVVEEPVVVAPVQEEEEIVEEEEEVVAPAPVVEKAPIVEPVVKTEAPAPAAIDSKELADIAKSLSEINKTLKAMLTILNK